MHEGMDEGAVQEQTSHVAPIACPQSPVQGVGEVAARLEPGRSAPAQGRKVGVGVALQQVPEDVPEQLVVAKAGVTGIDGNDERVRPRQLVEYFTAPVDSRDGGGQRSGDLVQETCLHEHATDRLGLVGQHLLEQVFAHAALIDPQLGHEVARPGAAFHPHGG